mmetsp:Transcript_16331/g.45519  ORF Transcript_16331/g.45519 Transcript_16331/m.45519 type:complete len:109 (-) Transcript_16331:323-649(-)
MAGERALLFNPIPTDGWQVCRCIYTRSKITGTSMGCDPISSHIFAQHGLLTADMHGRRSPEAWDISGDKILLVRWEKWFRAARIASFPGPGWAALNQSVSRKHKFCWG